MMLVCPDDYLMTESGEYHWTTERVIAAWDRARETFEGHLKWGRPEKVVLLMGVSGAGKSTWRSENQSAKVLYFDATFDLPWKREPYLQLAFLEKVPVEVVWIDTPLEVCLHRNSKRTSDRKVPEDVLRAMHDKISKNPPSEEEGFTLTRVRQCG